MPSLFARLLPALDKPADQGAAPERPDVPGGSFPSPGETHRRSLDVEVTTNEEGTRSTFTIMTGKQARDRMIIEPDGGDVAAYLRNPVVLWQHGHDGQRGRLPIGRGTNVKREGDGWKADVEWEEDEFASTVAAMVKRGTLSAVSIGWRTIDAAWEERDGREVYVIKRWELTEFSVVAVPADADALVTKRDDDDLRAEVQRLRAELAELRAAEEEPPAEGEEPTEAEPEPDPEPEPERTAPTVQEVAAAMLAMLPQIEESYERALGRA